MGTENAYLLFTHYGITEQDNTARRIEKASRISYLNFCRRMSFQKGTSFDDRDKLQKETDTLLSTRIPSLLQSVMGAADGKIVFDDMHRTLCEDMMQIYERTGGQTYGVVQRWLNLTLLNLVIINTGLMDSNLPVSETRKFFHAPVDQYLLEVATRQSKRFQHGLQLKCAPLWHNEEEHYQMEWFKPGETLPYEYWSYPEYIEFQLAVVKKLAEIEASQESHTRYQDILDWSFYAYMEGKQARYQ